MLKCNFSALKSKLNVICFLNNFRDCKIIFNQLLNRKAKLWLFLLIIFAITWLGAINVRFIIGNQLLLYDEFLFRMAIPPDEENVIFRMISYSSILIFFAYIFTFISAIFLIKNIKVNFRENPWLLVCIILFFVFSPVEFYSSFLDYKFFMLYLQNPATHDEQLKIFGERIGFLKGVPWIAMVSYYTIIVISIFQPLRKSGNELEEIDKIKEEDYSYKYDMHEEDDLILEEHNPESK